MLDVPGLSLRGAPIFAGCEISFSEWRGTWNVLTGDASAVRGTDDLEITPPAAAARRHLWRLNNNQTVF
jgi:hypothetical protein